MLEKTFELLEAAMTMADKEINQAIKKFSGKSDGKTRVKIKSGSTVNINGA